MNWSSTSASNLQVVQDIIAGDEAEALLSRRNKKTKLNTDADSGDDVPDDGMYRGQKAYKSHIKKNVEVPKAMRVGPQRSNADTVRTVTIVDYQPDVCKDYKGGLYLTYWF
jgi:RING finger protein 113A